MPVLAQLPPETWAPLALATAAIGGLLLQLRNARREDSGAIVKQAVELVAGMSAVADESRAQLQRVVDERNALRTEREALQEQVAALTEQVGAATEEREAFRLQVVELTDQVGALGDEVVKLRLQVDRGESA